MVISSGQLFSHAKKVGVRLGLRTPWRRLKRLKGRLAGQRQIGPTANALLEQELRESGPAQAIDNYTRSLARNNDPDVAYKLARTYHLLGDTEAAIQVLDHSSIRTESTALLKLDYLTKAGAPTASLTDLVPCRPKRQFLDGLTLLRKSITGRPSFETYMSVAQQGQPAWKQEARFLTRLGHAARRGGESRLAIESFERAIRATKVNPVPPAKSRSNGLRNPWRVLDDFLEAVGEWRPSVFPVAATLLGFVREGGFISHDYDMDFGVLSSTAHEGVLSALRRDWRFELDRGRSANVIKAKHVNGTAIDVYLYEQRGDHLVTQSHVYGWRFEPFELKDVAINGVALRVPQDPEHFLAQMYGTGWRTPLPGFESGLFAPNRFFPNKDELICAVLNKVVNAALDGREEKIGHYRQFLSENCEYELPQLGSTFVVDAVVGTGWSALDHWTPNTGGKSSHNFAATAAESMSLPHKSRGGLRVTPPSFKAKMDERIRRRRYLRDNSSVMPVTRPLTSKRQRDRIFAQLQLPVPQKLLERAEASEVLGLVSESAEVVVKPAKGSGSRGVMPLRRVQDGWLNLRDERVWTLDQIARSMDSLRIAGSPVRRWSAETLVLGSSNVSGHPMDYKFYMFQERCGLIVAKQHLPKGAAYRWFSPDWQDVDTGKYANALDPSIRPPADAGAALEMATTIATQFPTAFVRVDLIEGDSQTFLSELSPLPGQYHRFNGCMDAMLGALWEITECDYMHEFLTADRYSAALEAIRMHSGAEALLPD